ncbi:MAG: hypothetical protein PF482_06750 [Desulfobacteraceae bacterium]|nr:hypothetical protein [Desulfobacteraceae bacterium]
MNKTNLPWGELVLYGLGMFDMLRAYAIIEVNKVVEPLAEFETGNLFACGSSEPAAEEMVVIDNLKLGQVLTVRIKWSLSIIRELLYVVASIKS